MPTRHRPYCKSASRASCNPNAVYRFDTVRGELAMEKKSTGWRWFDPGLYEARRIEALAPDGELIPVTLMYRKDPPAPGRKPDLDHRLWRLRGKHAGGLSGFLDQSDRSRICLRHCPCARRRRKGPPLARPRPAAQQAQYVHGLHRGDRAPRCARRLRPGEHVCDRRKRRRPADGGHRQSPARSLCGHRRPRFRSSTSSPAMSRPHERAYDAGVRGVGRSGDPGRARLHAVLLAVRTT